MKEQQVHPLTRIGIWITVLSAAVWAGDVVFQVIIDYIPYAIAFGILVMAVGLWLSARKGAQQKKA